MSQANLNISAEQTGLAYTSDLNDALASINSSHSGATAPTNQVVAGKLWLDTSTATPVLKMYHNSWDSLFTFTSSGLNTNLNTVTIKNLTVTTTAASLNEGFVAGTNSTVNGSLTINGTATATNFNTTSDKRLKNNIRYMNSAVALDQVCSLDGVYYEMNGVENVGLIAQEVEEVIPEVVIEREDGYKGVNYSNLVAVLIEAVKEQQTQIIMLEERIIDLEAK